MQENQENKKGNDDKKKSFLSGLLNDFKEFLNSFKTPKEDEKEEKQDSSTSNNSNESTESKNQDQQDDVDEEEDEIDWRKVIKRFKFIKNWSIATLIIFFLGFVPSLIAWFITEVDVNTADHHKVYVFGIVTIILIVFGVIAAIMEIGQFINKMWTAKIKKKHPKLDKLIQFKYGLILFLVLGSVSMYVYSKKSIKILKQYLKQLKKQQENQNKNNQNIAEHNNSNNQVNQNNSQSNLQSNPQSEEGANNE